MANMEFDSAAERLLLDKLDSTASKLSQDAGGNLAAAKILDDITEKWCGLTAAQQEQTAASRGMTTFVKDGSGKIAAINDLMFTFPLNCKGK